MLLSAQDQHLYRPLQWKQKGKWTYKETGAKESRVHSGTAEITRDDFVHEICVLKELRISTSSY